MKKIDTNVLVIVLIALQIFSIIRTMGLERELELLQYAHTNTRDRLSTDIENANNSINSAMKEQASIIYSAGYEVGRFDLDIMQVPVLYTVTPKEVGESTRVSLDLGHEVVELTRDGMTFSGEVFFDMSHIEIYPTILVEQDGIQSITDHEGMWIFNLASETFPMFNVACSVNTSTSEKKNSNEYEYTRELRLNNTYYNKTELLVSADYVTYIDGEEVGRVDISELFGEHAVGSIDLKDSYTLNEGAELTNYVIAVDNKGFVYESQLEGYIAGSGTMQAPKEGMIRIKAPDGRTIADEAFIY